MAWLLLCGFSEEFERPQIAPRPEPKPWWNMPMVAIRGQNKPWLRILTLQSLTCRRLAEHAGKGMTNIEWYAVWSLLRLQPISLGFGGPKTFRMLVFCPVGPTWLHKQRCDVSHVAGKFPGWPGVLRECVYTRLLCSFCHIPQTHFKLIFYDFLIFSCEKRAATWV